MEWRRRCGTFCTPTKRKVAIRFGAACRSAMFYELDRMNPRAAVSLVEKIRHGGIVHLQAAGTCSLVKVKLVV